MKKMYNLYNNHVSANERLCRPTSNFTNVNSTTPSSNVASILNFSLLYILPFLEKILSRMSM